MENTPCIVCGLYGHKWNGKCLGCTARKIIYLRSPDRRTTVKLQKEVLKNLSQETRSEVLRLVSEMDKLRT